MVRSNLAQLIEQKSERDGVRVTKHRISKETGVAINTIKRYLRAESISYFDNDVISSFCQFFECQVGDLLKTVTSDTED